MSSATLALDRVVRYAPFGVRFRDVATDTVVSDGLELRELKTGIVASTNRTDVFVATRFPGLREVEWPESPEPYRVPHDEPGVAPASPPHAQRFTFELVDTRRRYVPFRFDATLPRAERGLFKLQCPGLTGSPPLPSTDVPLYSAPARIAPAGTASVRAELHQAAGGAPAAHAVLEVSIPGGPRHRGIADENGRVVVVFPYPEPPAPAGPPPPKKTRALLYQEWKLNLTVRYRPPGSPPSAAQLVPPDLCTVLTQPVRPLLSGTSPATPLTEATLIFGQELALAQPGRRTLYVA